MPHEIAEKKAKVLIIEARVDARTMVREAVKAIGFSQTVVVGSIEEAWTIFESEAEPPTWVISSLFSEDKRNALQLLAIFLSNSSLHKCRMSLLLSAEETYALPNAFEMGLLSWHQKPFTKTSLESEFSTLITTLGNDKTDGCLTAYEYLRKYYMTNDLYDTLIELDESMIAHFPNRGEFFLNLAEAQQLAGKIEDARKTVYQAKYLDDHIAKGAQQLLIMMEQDGSVSDTAKDLTFADAFGIKNSVVIEADETVSKQVVENLQSIGIKDVKVHSDGEAAWAYLDSNPEPDIVIQEWRIPKVTGPALIQRYRAKGMYNMAVIVYSALVKGKDQALVKEMGVANVMEKPLVREHFLTAFMATMRQEKFPTSYKTLERKIMLALAKKDMKEANTLKDRLLTSEDAPEGGKKGILAQFAFVEGDLDKARTLAIEALKNAGDSLTILNLIGKIFLKLRNFDDAIKCFNKAQEMSAGNLERLCLLAEAKTETGDFKAAEEIIDTAKKVDKDSQQVASAETKLALTQGDAKKAKEIMEQMDSLGDIVAFTNNRAVSLAKSGKLKESQELYERALESLPKTAEALRATVAYNLSLSYARDNNLKSAQTALNTAGQVADSPVAQKVQSLAKRVDDAVKTGAKLQLFIGSDKLDKEEELGDKKEESPDLRLFALDIKPSEMGLHQVFQNPSGMHEKVSAMVASIPRFTPQFKAAS